MLDKILEKLPTELSSVQETLENASYDKKNKEYMTASKLKVIDFDKVKNNYVACNIPNVDPHPKSNDALYISKDGVWFFIEFKNGNIDDKVNFEINKKIYDSLFVLFDIKFIPNEMKFNNCISFTREHMYYILVYNKDRYDENNQTKATEFGMKRQEKYILQKSKSRDRLKKSIMRLSGETLIHFGLDQFKGYFFKNVFTYTKEEFEKEFVNKYEFIEK